jgi:hypothetical protein
MSKCDRSLCAQCFNYDSNDNNCIIDNCKNCSDSEINDIKINNEPFVFNGKYAIYSLIYSIIWAFAVFLSFRCNGNKFDVIGFLGACLCPVIYIPYKLGTSSNYCGI